MHPPKTNTPANGARQSEPKSSGIPIHSQASYPSADAQATTSMLASQAKPHIKRLIWVRDWRASEQVQAVRHNSISSKWVWFTALCFRKRAASVSRQPGHAKIARLAPIAVDFDGAPSINRRKFTEAPRGISPIFNSFGDECRVEVLWNIQARLSSKFS